MMNVQKQIQKMRSKWRSSMSRIRSGFAIVLLALFSWAYLAIQPPPPKLCGSKDGPPVTALRIKLKDGRHLAYKEKGALKDNASYKVINVHGYGQSRHSLLPVSEKKLEEMGVYMVGFDRAGYGQSDPFPERSRKSEAYDIQELADALDLGPRFYVMTVSIGGYSGWSLLKYIPERIAGMVMLAPVTNFWWPGIPLTQAKQAFDTQMIGDKLALRVAHYAPWLLYFWMTQRVFPTSCTVSSLSCFSEADQKWLMKAKSHNPVESNEVTQQGVYESLYRDMMIEFGSWEFDPGDLKRPFGESNVSVHIWQGDEDYLVPVLLQQYIHSRLPWIRYHEIKGAGHLLWLIPGLSERILTTLLE